jgi:teichuronic acid biosynthesis protein TuaE
VSKIRIKKILVKNYLLFLGLWLVYAVASFTWVDFMSDAIRQTTFLLTGISVIFFAVFFFNRIADLRKFYYLWIFFLIGLIVVGVWEHATGNHLPASGYNSLAKHSVRFLPSGVYHNTNDFATYLSLSLPFLFSAIRYFTGPMRKLLLVIFSIFFGIGLCVLLFTSSRLNWVAVMIEFLFFFFFMQKASKKVKMGLVALLFAITTCFVFPVAVEQTYEIISSAIKGSYDSYALNRGSTIVRYNLFINGFFLSYEHAGFGVGAGNAQYHISNFGQYPTFGIADPHNWWLEVFINYGIFIFIGFVIFYLSLIKELFKIWKGLALGEEKMICEALTLSLVGFFFASCSPSSVMAHNAIWFIFAFSLAFLNYKRVDSRKKLKKYDG